jgi:23S rRNA (cytidine1920-2'-O)/16S rRNA (cytidine1409-2'-O)-methyltransferase
LASSRQQAQAAVEAGLVLVGGSVADKAARLVAPGDPVVLQGPGPRFVGRGGEKLDAALGCFAIDVRDRRALDAGASTGGFTDCLLQRGAAAVVAVDVGHGQIDRRLRDDPRVRVLERTNVRTLQVSSLGEGEMPFEPVGVVTADLSFISLVTVVPVLTGPAVMAGGDLVLLVKPQFEAGRAEVSRGRGVIRDPEVWRQTVLKVASALESSGTGIIGAMPSPLTGATGNTEFFLHATARRVPQGPNRLSELVDEAVDDARRRSAKE